ncbi:MAG: hypothetical protein WD069_19145 [Planctomycetales bacterium]
MKKLTALLMLVCLAAFTVGCGKEDAKDVPKTLTTDKVDNDCDGETDEAGETGEVNVPCKTTTPPAGGTTPPAGGTTPPAEPPAPANP